MSTSKLIAATTAIIAAAATTAAGIPITAAGIQDFMKFLGLPDEWIDGMAKPKLLRNQALKRQTYEIPISDKAEPKDVLKFLTGKLGKPLESVNWGGELHTVWAIPNRGVIVYDSYEIDVINLNNDDAKASTLGYLLNAGDPKGIQDTETDDTTLSLTLYNKSSVSSMSKRAPVLAKAMGLSGWTIEFRNTDGSLISSIKV